MQDNDRGPKLPKSVLILDDEALIAMMIEDEVRELGAETVLIFSDPSEAMDAASTAPLDCAILDIFIRGKADYLVARTLLSRGVPFVFSTGRIPESLDEDFRHVPVLSKPFSPAELQTAISQAMSEDPASVGPGEIWPLDS